MGCFGEGKIAFGSFPVFGNLHQEGADKPQEGGFIGKKSSHGSASAHLAVEVFAGVGGAQTATLGFRQAEDGEAFREVFFEPSGEFGGAGAVFGGELTEAFFGSSRLAC